MRNVYLICDDERDHDGIIQYLVESSSIQLNLYKWFEINDLLALRKILSTKVPTESEMKVLEDEEHFARIGREKYKRKAMHLIAAPELVIYDPRMTEDTFTHQRVSYQILDSFTQLEIPTIMLSPYSCDPKDAHILYPDSNYERIKELPYTHEFRLGYDPRNLASRIEEILQL